MSKREKGWDIASFAVRTLLTIVAAGILVLQANGYTIDFEQLTIERAGLISLAVSPANARVFLDGKPLHLQRGEFINTYVPDVYSLEVQLNGYRPWHHLVRVEAGGVVRFDQILLFPERVEIVGTRPPTDTERQRPLIDSRLRSSGTELWYIDSSGERLVTRLSVPILSATPIGQSHVVYQVDDGIHVIDIDGLNDVLIVAQHNPTPSRLMLSNNDRILTVIGSELTTQYQLQ